ncbi:MAG: glycoside hydrolase [Caldilineaceae bacterium]|nr:glycoside hydrolase [Caldilineaceae bacterium]
MSINLSGEWRFELDRDDRGTDERWYARDLTGALQLPGSLQAQGRGDDVTLETPWVGNIVDRSLFDDPRYAPYRDPDNIKYPSWLQPEKHYAGVAWYQRDIDVPPDWQGQRVTLSLERPHWETTVWLDNQCLGSNDSLATPHVYELGTDIAPGSHRLTVRVDNRMIVNVGVNAHSVSDHTQTNWNGIVGRLELRAGSPVWMRRVQAFPNVAARAVTLKIDFASLLRVPGQGTVTVTPRLTNVDATHTPPPVRQEFTFAALGGLADLDLSTSGGHLDVEIPLGDDAHLWDEFHPALYALDIDFAVTIDGHTHGDQQTISVGLREMGVLGTQLAINDRPLFVRGTLECAIFPLTGYPPTDVDAWKRIVGICKAHGLNQIRFHSWCPPEAAFVAADELGFYYQVECPAWANQGAALGEGRPLDQWLYREADRILNTYGNHPSFVMMAYGNEPAGRIDDFLSLWVTHWRMRDPRRVYTSGAGWPALPQNDYHNIPEPRVQRWGEGINSRINGLPPETRTDYADYVARLQKPIVSHEIGQWCVYPNFAEMAKYTGVLKPKNFEIFRDFLEANHMGDQAHHFLLASGKLQALCYKEDIESALRTPGFAGFQLLDLHDFPGQGTALVGVLDPFWDEKGYITAAEFARFCSPVVPLALLDKRYWTTDETFTADVRIAQFRGETLHNVRVDWRLVTADGAVAAQGELPLGDLPVGNDNHCGPITAPLADVAPAQKLTLVIGVTADNAPRAENDWDLWLFAPAMDVTAPDDVLIISTLDESARAHLTGGGTVLWLPDPATVHAPSTIGFSSVFWNTAWTRGQAPHTLGILCDPGHPVFADFPTEGHSNWQWWELIHGSAAMVLDDLSPSLRPLVQPIDTWFEARRLGLLVEARVGGGKLAVCSMDLKTDLDQRPVARQFRASLLAYLTGPEFEPAVEVGIEGLENILKRGT